MLRFLVKNTEPPVQKGRECELSIRISSGGAAIIKAKMAGKTTNIIKIYEDGTIRLFEIHEPHLRYDSIYLRIGQNCAY